jgi:hypothetical protein
MEAFLNGTTLIEGLLLSFLLALWMTWLSLRGLFRLMPVASVPGNARPAQLDRFARKDSVSR